MSQHLREEHGRLSPPSVHITYDLERYGRIESVELPFVIGVFADLRGDSGEPSPPIASRNFVQVERGNLDAVLSACAPRLRLEVPNRLQPGPPLYVELSFRSMADFDPDRVAAQVPGLLESLEAGNQAGARQLDEILHAPAFQRLEARWRNLRYLLWSIETSASLKVRVLHATKEELLSDLRQAVEPERSAVFLKVYEPYTVFRGEPFAVLLGDYEFSNTADDLELLERISFIAAAAHAPFIAGAGPRMFGWTDFAELRETRRMARIFEGDAYARWRAFRQNMQAIFTALVVPHMLLRLPYGDTTVAAKGFSYQEAAADSGSSGLLWGNAAFALVVRLAEAFRVSHWCAAIVGPQGGGLVTGLPAFSVADQTGNLVMQGPLDLSLDDVQEAELVDCGFNCLVHRKGTSMAAFFSAVTCLRHQAYQENAAVRFAARLPYVLAVARFAHYLKAIIRDRFEQPRPREEYERVLNDWIARYVTDDGSASLEVKARFPLQSARIVVEEAPGRPGRYWATAFLRPHFQLDDIGVDLRVIAEFPAALPAAAARG